MRGMSIAFLDSMSLDQLEKINNKLRLVMRKKQLESEYKIDRDRDEYDFLKLALNQYDEIECKSEK